MSCQSLDNDEILNVRWATEDPNPVSKVNEKRRLEEMGSEVVKAKIDPRIVDAMRSIRALEEGDTLDEHGYLLEDGAAAEGEDEEGEAEEPAMKKRRVDGDDEDEEQPEEPPNTTGLLSADTLESLKYFAQIRQNRGAPAPQAPKPAARPAGGALLAADYGSDEDD
jgi:hypothetical protein